GYRVTGYETQ
nr:Chain A, TIA-1 prion-like domain [Homo sapiens]